MGPSPHPKDLESDNEQVNTETPANPTQNANTENSDHADVGRIAREMIKALDTKSEDGVQVEALVKAKGYRADVAKRTVRLLEEMGLIKISDTDALATSDDLPIVHLESSFGRDPSASTAEASSSNLDAARGLLMILAMRARVADANLELKMLDEVVNVLKEVLVASMTQEKCDHLYITAQDLVQTLRAEDPDRQILLLKGPRSSLLVPTKEAGSTTFQVRLLSRNSSPGNQLDALLLQGEKLVPVAATDQDENLENLQQPLESGTHNSATQESAISLDNADANADADADADADDEEDDEADGTRSHEDDDDATARAASTVGAKKRRIPFAPTPSSDERPQRKARLRP
ncbi:Hypothetical Protein FCC1311_033412 [Hondaea fermentalgiana]|uniref:Uncharacterized protein n=1 Tax=Hondaea fermentalgiana TaxID=2315210 RepID=A0A2R5GBM7_9STRA|nr:Hypothetical Protein FCC1311_033412 [Hondaea fermentalgiana]|eukprot:GBG27118.1 Hypothetical Protein FCC1311_033412 [Hondaea fermentalgiana]